jgi:hypothetical protein
MEMGFRVFFLEDSGFLRPIPWATFVGLYFSFPSIRFPEYAGQAVKSIHAVVELQDKAPVQILESLFFITHFDGEGNMDPAKRAERQQLAIAMTRTNPDPGSPKGVIDIRSRLSERQYDHQFRWCPTEAESEDYHRRIEEILGM